MTLPVPLTIRVGDDHVTREAQSLSFRKEAVGGCRSISFSLARSLADLDGLDPLAKVYVYDGRNAETVVEGRLADTGRGANAEGERWDCVAFGPAQAASDWAGPLIFIDQDLGAWWQVASTNAEHTFSSGSRPDGSPVPSGLLGVFRDGLTLATSEVVTARYDRLHHAGQKMAGFLYTRVMGVTNAAYDLDGLACNVDAADAYTGTQVAATDDFTTVLADRTGSVGIDFTNGRDVLDLQMRYAGPGGANTPDTWAFVSTTIVRALLHNADGTEVTGVTYGLGTLEPYVHEVVNDLLGRPGLLDEFDGANATVDDSGTLRLDQLAYPDSVTPAQVLEDLMRLAPAYRWTTTPDATGGGYGFRWETWPTTVRYEATLDDGGSFPLSTQSLYNRVAVRWRDASGRTRTTFRTMACAALDDAGVVRQAFRDLSSEVGSLAQAEAAGDAFLDEHNVPKNSGTLTVARPIRDLTLGAFVQPWEIEPGELVRIRGVEAYPDAFNADTNDGQGVFRIHAVDYTTDGNVATLALDSDPRETEDALVKLMNQRTRR